MDGFLRMFSNTPTRQSSPKLGLGKRISQKLTMG